MLIYQTEKPLGEILIEHGAIQPHDLRFALDSRGMGGERIGQVLLDLGYIRELDLIRAIAAQIGAEYMTLKDFPESPPVFARLDLKYLKHHKFIPLFFEEGKIRVAVADPFNCDFLDDVARVLGVAYDVIVASEEDIIEAVERCYGSGATTMEKIISSFSDEELSFLGKDEVEDVDHLRDMASEAPVIQLVNLFISRAVELGASDIHIEPQERDLRVRCRVDGILQDLETPPKRLHPAIVSRVKIMAELNIAERRLPQDGRARVRASGREIDLRISIVPSQFGESAVLRILDHSSTLIGLEDLGFPRVDLEAFKKAIRRPNGILMVTGPTGSGKTTTLYSALALINSPDLKIITVEDPIEYHLPGITQIQVKPEIGLSFAAGLRSIVRQDPDVIMIGEIRDLETAEIAIQSALTGHLVLSTVHTNDAPSTITRLVDMGVEPYLISSCLNLAMAQRLVRTICVHCKRKTVVTAEALAEAGIANPTGQKTFEVYEGAGCKQCRNKGYAGRVAIFELMIVSPELKNLMLQNSGSSGLRNAAIRAGMRTLRDDGWSKVLRGITTLDEVVRTTQQEDLDWEQLQ
jgi:type II secretion system protein E